MSANEYKMESIIMDLYACVNLTQSTKYKSEFATMEALLNQPPFLVESMRCKTLHGLNSHAQESLKWDIAKSNKLRNLGNDIFRADSRRNALAASRLYTQAIFAAPPGETLALAHANRAMALQTFGYFRQAYDDCECALEQNYPVNLRHKLWARQAYCARELGDAVLLQQHLDTLADMTLNEKFSAEVKKLGENLQDLQLNVDKPVLQQAPFDDHRGTLEILQNDEKGRYMISKEPIAKNALICSERASSFVPYAEMSVCQECACTQLIPFPCCYCDGKVVYCSLKCRRAHAATHKYECAGHKLNLFDNYYEYNVPFRMLIDNVSELANVVRRKHTAAAIWAELMQSNGTAFAQSMRMVTHLDKMQIFIILKFALVSYVLVQYLAGFTNFFNDLSDMSTSPANQKDLELVTGSLILRSIGQWLINGTTYPSIRHIRAHDNPVEFDLIRDHLWVRPGHIILGQLHQFANCKEVVHGSFPYLSLCNHSCVQCVQPKFSGRNISFFASKPIKAGEEIFTNYVTGCNFMSTEERKERLKRVYHFDCKCYRCNNENSNEDGLKFLRYRCDQPKCRKIFTATSFSYLEPGALLNFKCPICFSIQRWHARYCKFHLLLEEVNTLKKRKELYKLFDSFDEWLLEYNVFKSSMANKIVRRCYAAHLAGCHLTNSEFLRLSKLMNFVLRVCAEDGSTNDLVYFANMTYLWDFIALGKYKPTEDEVQVMLQTVKYASDDVQQFTMNYYNDFIADKLKI